MNKPFSSRVVSTNNLPLRDAPGFSSRPLKLMPKGLKVTVGSGCVWLEQSLWIEVEAGGTRGWCVANGVVAG